jgi:acyl-coenzyme A synthetase/AMP-(fatty) acid ligase
VVPQMEKTPAELQRSLQAAMAQQLNPLFKIHDLVIVSALPRTASNKVMRRVLRDQYRRQGSAQWLMGATAIRPAARLPVDRT